MDDLISRADAIEALEEAKERYFDRAVIIARMQDILRAIPSAQPKQGEWIRQEAQHKEDKTVLDCRVCSECGAGYVIHNNIKDLDTDPPRHCPNCGARMKGADDE